METYKQEFIDFMLETGALKFGDFTLKSGRKSPFFINMGAFTTGSQLKRLSYFYARAIKENIGLDFDILFGPSYKGIPLACVTSVLLFELYGKEVRYASNRKEIKDHGDTGVMLGAKPKDSDRIVIIEDVTTSGLSIAETVPILKAQADIEICGLVVSMDRQEKALDSDVGALENIKNTYGFNTFSIVCMSEVIDYLKDRKIDGEYIFDEKTIDAFTAYYRQYGTEN